MEESDIAQAPPDAANREVAVSGVDGPLPVDLRRSNEGR
jgi:hypothetical protein